VKLLVIIVEDQDADPVITALTDRHYGVTRISTTGGVLAPGNSTLLVGVENHNVSRVIDLIADIAEKRTEYVAFTHPHAGGLPLTGGIEVEIGGMSAYVLDIYHFEQV
jgi:uncharacterized protein YaaQ